MRKQSKKRGKRRAPKLKPTNPSSLGPSTDVGHRGDLLDALDGVNIDPPPPPADDFDDPLWDHEHPM